MKNNFQRKHQLVDWRSAVWAGMIAGTIFLVLNLFWVSSVMGANAWVMIRLFGSIILGPEVLAPPATFHAQALVAGLLIHYFLSIAFTCVLAFVTHQWGLITGIILGGLFGLELYTINVYTLTLFFPWFLGMRHVAFLATHVAFGMCAGGIYELLEVEIFEPVGSEKE